MDKPQARPKKSFWNKLTQQHSRNPTLSPSRPTIDAALVKPPLTNPGQCIYDQAKDALSDLDRATLGEMVQNEEELGVAIDQAITSVLLKQQECEKRRWAVTVRGHKIRSSDVASSLSKILEKLKPGLNWASEVDPIHIGLPVAAIRLIVGIAAYSSDQMERLLLGMKTAACMVKRLSLYFDYFLKIPPTASSHEFEKTLSATYAHIFAFLTIGHRAWSSKAPWELLWSFGAVAEFEKLCTADALKLDSIANHCDRSVQLDIKSTVDQALLELKRLDILSATIEAMDVKIDLHRIHPAACAAWDYTDDQKARTVFDYCLPGTRQALIDEMVEWCHGTQSIFWLSGMAGTGKSTLIRTVARAIDAEQTPVLSFFFRSDISEQKTGELFVPTLVTQLMTKFPLIRPHVAIALDADLNLPRGSIATQFQKLLDEPLSRSNIPKIVVVVDAMDECKPRDAHIILTQLAFLTSKHAFLKLIITSRPESDLRIAFNRINPDSVRLEEVQASNIENDIRIFLTQSFSDLASKEELDEGWPGQPTINTLVDSAKPLFIFAATLFLFVSDHNPQKRLKNLLQQYKDGIHLSTIEATYLPILEQTYRLSEQSVEGKQEIIDDFKEIVGTIVMLEDPLSVPALAVFIARPESDIKAVLKPLHSVLSIPSDLTKPVQLLHKSFKDFLLDDTARHEFAVSRKEMQTRILANCITLMEKSLHRDLLGLTFPGIQRKDIPQARIDERFPPELQYACIHWPMHFEFESQEAILSGCLVAHLLHWIEAMSWLGKIMGITELIHLDRFAKSEDMNTTLLVDTKRFLDRFRGIADGAPLQIYCSALCFTPTSSVLRQLFYHEETHSAWFDLLPDAPDHWDTQVASFDIPFVYDVSLSTCAALMATLADAQGAGSKLQIWRLETGEELHNSSQVSARHTMFIGQTHIALVGDVVKIIDVMGRQLWRSDRSSGMPRLYTSSQKHFAFVTGRGQSRQIMIRSSTTKFDAGHIIELSMIASSDSVTCLALRQDDEVLAVGTASLNIYCLTMQGTVILAFDFDSVHAGLGLESMDDMDRGVCRLDFGPGGQLAVLCDDGMKTSLWTCELSGDVGFKRLPESQYATRWSRMCWARASPFTHPGPEPTLLLIGIRNELVTFSPDDQSILMPMMDGSVSIVDTRTGTLKRQLDDRVQNLVASAWSNDGALMCVATYQRLFMIQEKDLSILETGTLVEHCRYLLISPDSKWILCAASTCSVWSRSGQKHLELNNERSVAVFATDSKKLVVFGEQGLQVVKIDTGDIIFSQNGPAKWFPDWKHGCYPEIKKLISQNVIPISDGQYYCDPMLIELELEGDDPESGCLKYTAGWIECHGKKLFWLPVEYRGSLRVGYDDVLVIGAHNKLPCFYKVKMDAIPKLAALSSTRN